MNVLIIVGICVLMGVIGQLLMKKGMNQIGRIGVKDLLSPKIFSIVFQKYVFMGACVYFLVNILWLVALSMADISYVYPLIATGYVITAILAWVFFKEKLTLYRLAGILLICVGAYLIVIKI